MHRTACPVLMTLAFVWPGAVAAANQDTYGLGTGTTPGDAVNARYDFFRFHETLYRQVHRHLAVQEAF